MDTDPKSKPAKRSLDLGEFIDRLRASNIVHFVEVCGLGNSIVHVSVMNERWEIEFFPDAPPEVEVFRSTGEVCDINALELLFERFADRPF